MDSELKIALFQSNLIWEDKTANLKHFEKEINVINYAVDLFLLPEMFSTGFTMNPELLAESMQEETLKWMVEIAAKKEAAIAGSLIIKEETNFYNRFVFVHPSGKIDYYNKRHLFSLANEHKVYKAGSKKVIINYKNWRILPQVCYDLRFPVWTRNVDDYDLLLYVANWPKVRITAWDTLLKARAIENLSYTIGVNRVGTDANNLEYNGHSAAFDCLGTEITNIAVNKESVTTVILNKQHIIETRKKLNFLRDRDKFNLEI